MTASVPRCPRWLRAIGACLVAAGLAACGGGDDVPSAPNGFQGNVAAAVPLVAGPRVAASTVDGDTWVAWVEGGATTQTLVGARVNSVGIVARRSITQPFAGTIRDVQVTMVGAAPVVTWRQVATTGAVSVAAASFDGVAWFGEFGSTGSAQGDVRALALPGGELSLQWTRLDASGRFQLVAARRSAFALWSAPLVVRGGAAGAVLLRSSQSSDGSGGLIALWSEAPSAAAATPQALYSSLYDATVGAWGAPLVVDAGGFYSSPAIGSIATSAWLAVWAAGDPSAPTAVSGKRYASGAWSAATDRIDQGADARIAELVVAPRNFRVVAGWIGVAAGGGAPGNVRVAAFDTTAAAWKAPVLVGASATSVPSGLALRGDGSGAAAAAWALPAAAGGLQLALTDATGTWQAASQLDAGGVAPDLGFFAATDLVTVWSRPLAGGLADVAVRRTR